MQALLNNNITGRRTAIIAIVETTAATEATTTIGRTARRTAAETVAVTVAQAACLQEVAQQEAVREVLHTEGKDYKQHEYINNHKKKGNEKTYRIY